MRRDSYAATELAREFDVPREAIVWWWKKGVIQAKEGSNGYLLRIPILYYPVVKALSEGASFEEAKATIADIEQRLERRGFLA